MKDVSKQFRVEEGERSTSKNGQLWRLAFTPGPKPAAIQKLLEEHTLAGIEDRSRIFSMHSESLFSAAVIFQAMDAAGKDGAIRLQTCNVRPESARLRGVPQLQNIPAPRNWSTRFSLARGLHRLPERRPDRHFLTAPTTRKFPDRFRVRRDILTGLRISRKSWWIKRQLLNGHAFWHSICGI